MSPLELSKKQIVQQLQKLCAHCSAGRAHNCPIEPLTIRIQAIRGVPLIVNNEFRGVLWR
jgi:hypothetical protein